MSKLKKIIIGIAITTTLAAAGGAFFVAQKSAKIKEILNVDTIYGGITVDGINVGGLTKDEALSVLSDMFLAESQNKKIILVHDDKSWDLRYKDINAGKDAETAAQEAYNTARDGSYKERYALYKKIQETGFDITAKVVYDDLKLDKFLQKTDEQSSTEVKDSKIYRKDGQFVIEDEVKGFKMNKEDTKLHVIALLNTYSDGQVTLSGEETNPKITKEDNKKITSLLGTFSTKYTGADSLGRNINLKVGSEHVNGTLVAPGDVFSMNEALGEQTYANGYRNASVIVNGKLEDGIAGGVCQITTTLYNAVVKSELDIVERKNHSLAVAYVPLGQDAAVAGTYKDFKFKNNLEYPVYVETYAKNGVLVANVYGYEKRSSMRKVELEHVYIESIPKPPEKITQDPNLPEGERIVTYEGKTGHKVSTFKKVYENGELLSREWFNDSVYSPVADEVTVGTGPKKKEDIAETQSEIEEEQRAFRELNSTQGTDE